MTNGNHIGYIIIPACVGLTWGKVTAHQPAVKSRAGGVAMTAAQCSSHGERGS